MLDLPDKPSIAVLPFANMSGDPEQEYFSDGLTEDIITELSRFRELFVIARNSSFAYKGKATPVQEMGETLGVQYVVEGSVRKAGDRIRVTAQLVESATGHHIWADRYDRGLEDIFAVQDEITEIIVATIAGRLEEAQRITARRKPPRSLAAYDLLLRGKDVLNRTRYDTDAYTHSGIEDARQLFNQALELEPEYGLALAYLSETYLLEHSYGHEVDLTIPADCAEKAVVCSPDDSRIHSALSWIQLLQHNYQPAEAHAEKAIALNPNDTEAVHTMGCVLSVIGRHEEAMTWHYKGFGTMSKPLHAGRAAMNGLLAARWASRGLTSNPAAIECPQGFAATQSTTFEPRSLPGPGDAFAVESTLFKHHAACFLTHAAIDAAAALRRESGFALDEVRRVRVRIPRIYLRSCNIARLRNGLEVKFSIGHVVPMTLAGLDTGDASIYDETTATRSDLIEVREKVYPEPDDIRHGYVAELILELANGTTLSRHVDAGVPEKDLEGQWQRLQTKFRRLAEPVIGRESAGQVISFVAELEEANDLSPLLDACARTV